MADYTAAGRRAQVAEKQAWTRMTGIIQALIDQEG